MVALSIKADLKPLQRAFVDLGARQVPFATALALTSLAKGVVTQEQAEVDRTFKTPTPFTRNAFRIESATKSKPIAIVAVKNIQQQYLAPYVNGGERFLGSKRGMLVPRDIPLNAYGNLPRNKLKQLLAKPGVFVGEVKTRSGKTIRGVWQRGVPAKFGRNGQTLKRSQPLKLLIQFEDTTEAPKHLGFYERAQAYLRANAAREMDIAMRRALATARR